MISSPSLLAIGNGFLLGVVSFLLPVPVSAEQRLSFNALEFLGASQKQGCEYRVAMRKFRKSPFDYCYETSPRSKKSYAVYDLRKDPEWIGLYRKDAYLLIIHTGIVGGYGRFWGKGDIKGVIENENNGKKYSINCLGRRSSGRKYGYCISEQIN